MSNTLELLGLSTLAGLAIPAGGLLAAVERITNSMARMRASTQLVVLSRLRAAAPIGAVASPT